MRYHGEYQHTVDAKGRVSLPAKFRKALPEDLIIVPWQGGALRLFSEDEFEEWMAKFFRKEDGTDGFNPLSESDERLRRYLSATAENVTVDGAGRITLSASKRDHGGITKDVYIIGDVDHVEIWDKKRYEDDKSLFSFDNYVKA